MRNSKIFVALVVTLALMAATGYPSLLMADTAQSHATHFFSEKGPKLPHDESGCYVCHASGDKQCQTSPVFADDKSLTDTHVCDVCHSPGGAFDGVAMAKANWNSSVYQADGLAFQADMEQWCATCHDDAPAHSRYQVFDVLPVVVDNLQGSHTGTWSIGSNPGYYGTNYHYHAPGSGADTFTWTPTITIPGTYEVFARWVADPVQATDATYTVYHDDGETQVARDQTAQGSQWVSLGYYALDGVNDRIELADNAGGQVCADAIQCVYLATNAPNIVGDNETYGFYVSGHGQDVDVNCLSCHDAGYGHIDDVHRTYQNSLDNYQAAYRLKSIDGGEPLKVPRSAYNPYDPRADGDFALCFDCHNKSEVVGGGDDPEVDVSHTNFWDDDGSPHNDHYFHLRQSIYDSDWDGISESGTSCVTCHNVHGSPSQAMIRHGELISTPGTTDKVPALNFTYLTPDPDPEATVEESVGARYNWPGNSISQNHVCTGCHGWNISWYRYPYLAPHLSDPVADPETVSISGASGSTVITCNLSDFNTSGGYMVTIDLTTLNGSSAQPMYDDGNSEHCDAVAGDGIYSICVVIPAEAGSGSRTLVITAADDDGHSTIEVTLDVEIPGEVVWDNESGDGKWSTALNWSTDTVPVAGQSVAFNTTSDTDCNVEEMTDDLASISLNYGYNGTVALNADSVGGTNELTVTGDIIVNSGTVLCKGDTTAINAASGGDVVTPHGQGLVINAANITVGENGHISADSAGFPQGEGPGIGYTGHESAGGAAYGGSGGQGVNSPGGSTYGSVSEPTALGSGGVISISGHTGGTGGGAIKLNVGDTLTINGTVSANGGDSTQYGSGGGGGSLWLMANSLAGSGSITADGGSSATTNKSGGGGGGRIALQWTTRSFDGVIRAKHGSGYRCGKNGTIWVPEGKWNELWNSDYHVNGDIAIVADASVASLPDPYTFVDLIIDSGVTLECQGDPAAINEASGGIEGNPHGSGITINAENVTVEGTLSADGLGFPQGEGPGIGYTGHESAGGAAYGGNAGYGVSSPGGSTYGSVSEPTALGSGGIISISGHAGGPGGGAIKLNVSDTLTINGTVSANGDSSSQYGSGGAGGSLWLIAETLAGSGSITADGGSSVTTNKSGGGGGGRIALEWGDGVDARTFNGVLRAKGGSGYGYGNHGTIWVPGDKWNALWNATHHVNGSIALAPGEYGIDELYIESGAVLECQGNLADINTPSGGVEGNPHGSGVIINADNMTIEENAAISANSLGFVYNNRGPAQTGYSGGGYGGRGGPGYDGTWGAPVYGSPSEPSALGSAGRHYGCAGSGGGAVKLNVADTFTIDGAVTANGQDGSGCCDNGGGAGGSIWIVTDTLAGSGAMTADGGNGTGKGGAGGGGRIAVYFTDNVSIVQEAVSVFGGNSSYESGDDGTIVWSPVGGYAEANVLPQAQVVPSPDGTVTVTFKATDVGDTINSVYSGTETVVIVNDSDADFVDGAKTWTSSTSEGYAGDIHYAEKDPGGAFPASCTWTPTIPEPGNYKVFARWTSHSNRATDAPYTINYDGNSQTIEVNQEINGSRWNYLGTYAFADDSSGTIVLTNDANEYVMADAVKLVADFGNDDTDTYNLCCFEYSTDGGTSFNPPVNGDDSGCLSAGWKDNNGSGYTAGATFDDATAYAFVWDSRHADLTGLDVDQNDVQIRFKARNLVTQDATVFHVDSHEYTICGSFWLDNITPDGYSVHFDQPQLDSLNHIAASFTFAGAEVGATYSYSIDDTNGATDPVTGTGTIATATDQVAGLDVSELDDGMLTLTVFLTDAFGNVGPEVNHTVNKNTADTYSVHIDQSVVNAANETAVSFTFSEAPMYEAYSYSIDDTNGATSPVTGTGTTASSEDQVTGINVSGLDDGTLTLIVSLAESPVADAVLKDTESPTGYAVSIDQEHVFSGNETAVSFTFAGAQVGSTYSYAMDDTNGGTAPVTGTGTVAAATDQVTGINVSGLDDDTLTLTVSLTDPSGNTGPEAVDTVLKDTLPPSGYSVSIDQTHIYSGNQAAMSFTFSAAEVGAAYSYSVDDTNEATEAVTGTGIIASAAHQVTGTNVSGLDDDTLTLTVSLTDVPGNGGSNALDSVVKDTQSPTGMDALWMVSVASNSATVQWNEASDEHWNGGAGHYEIWFGKDLADVQGRTGTASAWDESDDSGLGSASTVTTTVTGLDLASHTYYFKIWAVDDFGNEATTLYVTADAVADSRVWDNESGDGLWSNPLNWSGDTVPLIGDHVVFNSTSDTPCLANSVVDHLGSITLDSGYSQTVTLPTDSVHGSNTLTIDGDLVVNSGKILCLGDQGAINVASGGTELVPHGRGIVISAANVTVGDNGHISADSEGFPTTEGPGGAIHGGGGYGGRGGAGYSGVTGLTYGSLSQPTALGSGGRHYNLGGSGGGAIKLVVAGTVTVDGTISANGEDSTQCCDNGGGSGGSLWVIADTLAGSGFITADGGEGAAKGGAGGGGRIALEWNTRTFDGVISAAGAVHSWGEEYSGAHGTIWVPEDKWDELWDSTHPVNGSVALAPNSHPDVPATYQFEVLHINSGVTLECQGDLADINEASGGEEGNPHGSGVIIDAPTVVIEEDAALSANELGFVYNNKGPGTTGYGGAGYGGRGGAGYSGVIGLTYGSLSQPTALGSSGRHYSRAGSGGGAIKLIVDNLTVNGTLSANGQNASGCCDNGGGSGGSLWVIANTLAGSGSITADGGNGSAKGGSGGGGRIALEWTSRSFDGVISAAGAVHSWGEEYSGAHGTIWVPEDKWDKLWDDTHPVNGSIALAPNSHPDVPDTYVFGELHIDSGVTLECQSDLADINEASGGEEGNPHGSGVVIDATSIVVEEGAAISANELGFVYNNQGPGTTASGGAGYGGRGGAGYGGVIGLTYGSLSQPTALGSSGRHYSRAGSGGGAIKLIVDNLTVDGTLSANGQNASGCCDNGGGSGGSLWVIANTLAGSGAVTADGGNGSAKGGSGGGGRIALEWTNRYFNGVISAEGAVHPWGEEYYGNHGTIWVPEDKWNELWDAAHHVNGSVALAPGEYDIDELYIDGGATLECQGNVDDINTASGGVEGNPHGSGVTINADNVTIEEDGAISANRLGFIYNNRGPAQAGYSGGGYGGRGGPGYGGAWGAPVYGSVSEPSALGSAGRQGSRAGSGGGAVKLNVADTLTIDGAVTADGQDSTGCCDNGGGAGGSIWINTDVLAGSGTMTADGGNGAGKGGAGGGGRIAAYFSSDTWSIEGTASVIGGTSSYENGEDGTVVWSPIGGYAVENVIPAAQCAVTDGVVTITFKVKGPREAINGAFYGQEVIVNDSEAACDDGTQPWTYSTSNGYAGDQHYAVTDAGGPVLSTCTWTPDIPWAGNYKVYAWWTEYSNRATDAPYTINYAGDSTTQDVNQRVNGSRWNYLGTFNFATGEDGNVVLTNDANGYVMADAVRFLANYPTDQYTIHTFEYSVDDGQTFNPPNNGDDSGCLSSGWKDNDGASYEAGLTFAADALAYTFTWDTFHTDVPDTFEGALQENVQIRFKVRNTATQDETTYHVDSRSFVTSESFVVDDTGESLAPMGSGGDADGDGIPDDWESMYGVNDPDADADMDGLSNLGEYENSTDPTARDTDGDGISDGWEVDHGFNPLLIDAAKIWDNESGDGYWSNPINWSGNTLPAIGDVVVFNASLGDNCTGDIVTNHLSHIVLDYGYTGTLTIQQNAVDSGDTLTVSGDIAVNEGAIVCEGDPTAIGDGTEQSPHGEGMTLEASNITVASGAEISVDGQGFEENEGPGAGSSWSENNVGAGAGHGGYGGDGFNCDGGAPYGSEWQPVSLGSGGAAYGTGGGNGGGAIKLVVSNVLTIDGIVSANGNDYYQPRAGGGAGGSIWILADTLQGAGIISADGGDGSMEDGGGGSGGRIRISTTTGSYLYTGTISATGGTGHNAGDDGTVHSE